MKILKYAFVLIVACCGQSIVADQGRPLNLDALKNSIPKSNIHQLRKNRLLLESNQDFLQRELEHNGVVNTMNQDAIIAYEATEKSRLEEEYNAQKALYEKAVFENTSKAIRQQVR